MDKRIAYYTRKVAEWGAVHHTKRKNPYRYDRLMKYKKLMHQKLLDKKKTH